MAPGRARRRQALFAGALARDLGGDGARHRLADRCLDRRPQLGDGREQHPHERRLQSLAQLAIEFGREPRLQFAQQLRHDLHVGWSDRILAHLAGLVEGQVQEARDDLLQYVLARPDASDVPEIQKRLASLQN